jgi:hypothetical protein
VKKYMFEVIKFRWFISKVQAELKAQIDQGDFHDRKGRLVYSQGYVNLICQVPENLELLKELRENPKFVNPQYDLQIFVSHVLASSLNSDQISMYDKEFAGVLLAQRLIKARSGNVIRRLFESEIREFERIALNFKEQNPELY